MARCPITPRACARSSSRPSSPRPVPGGTGRYAAGVLRSLEASRPAGAELRPTSAVRLVPDLGARAAAGAGRAPRAGRLPAAGPALGARAATAGAGRRRRARDHADGAAHPPRLTPGGDRARRRAVDPPRDADPARRRLPPADGRAGRAHRRPAARPDAPGGAAARGPPPAGVPRAGRAPGRRRPDGAGRRRRPARAARGAGALPAGGGDDGAAQGPRRRRRRAGLRPRPAAARRRRPAGVGRRAASTTSPAASGVADRVRVVGRVDDTDLAALYAGALAVVVPSRAEGFGLPVVEAMSLGVPVVTSDDPALVEVGGGAGPVAPVGDLEALAAAIAGDGGRTGQRRAGRSRSAAGVELLPGRDRRHVVVVVRRGSRPQ